MVIDVVSVLEDGCGRQERDVHVGWVQSLSTKELDGNSGNVR